MSRYRIYRVLLALALIAALVCPGASAKSKYEKPYYIMVDLTNQVVTVYNTADDSIARQMICSTGLQDTTPRGTYYLPKADEGERENWYFFAIYNCYAQYATRIIDNVLFHSIPCSYKSQRSVSQLAIQNLGQPASHGCIRMLWPDAKFIAESCEPATRVEIYKSRQENEDLRQLLLSESYDGSVSYEAYLGVTHDPNTLGLTSEGNAVRDLQCRLRDLGIYNGEITGVYHGDTVNAVRLAQRLMGVETSGVASEDFQRAIFSADAPVAFNVVLKSGSNGPAVRALQSRLTELGLYEGPLDSIYDIEVAAALKRFQVAYGYEISDDAAIDVQKTLAYEVEHLHDLFDPMGGYHWDTLEETVDFGRVRAASGIRIRSEPTGLSDVLGHVPDRAVVILLEKSREWSRIRHGQAEGYVKNEYMDYFTAQNEVVTYTSADGYASYEIGRTREQYMNGEVSQAELIDLNNPDEEADAIVNTGRDDVMLNLRQIPSSEGAVLGMLPNGAHARPLLDMGEWMLVDCNGTRGYLMTQYIARPEEESAVSTVTRDNATLTARVKPLHGRHKAQVFDADSDDAEVLGHLKPNVKVDVIGSTENGWCHIVFEGHDGYMRDEDLLFPEAGKT